MLLGISDFHGLELTGNKSAGTPRAGGPLSAKGQHIFAGLNRAGEGQS